MSKRRRKLKYRRLFIAFNLVIIIFGFLYLNFKPIQANSFTINGKVEKLSKLKIGMTGDVLIHGTVYKDALINGKYNFIPKVENIKPLVNEVDLAFYNQESIIGGKSLGLSTYPMFNSPEEIGDAMLNVGFNMVSLANNHTLDRGEKAILNSLNYWKDKGVLTAGSYGSSQERDNPKILTKNNIKYGMLAYTTLTNGFTRPKGKEYYLNVYNEEQAIKDIKNLRSKVNFLIVSMHWGAEYTELPVSEQQKIASFLSDQGVDLIIGHHPHVLQKIDKIDNTWVVYSLGNFLSSQIGEAKLVGAFVTFDVKKKGTGVSLSKPTVNLTYNYYNSGRKNIKVYRFDQLNNNLLPNYQNIYQKYAKIISGTNEEVIVAPLN